MLTFGAVKKTPAGWPRNHFDFGSHTGGPVALRIKPSFIDGSNEVQGKTGELIKDAIVYQINAGATTDIRPIPYIGLSIADANDSSKPGPSSL